MSLAAIADAAGTTRQAIYRRWTSKVDVAVAAIESLPEAAPLVPTGDHRADLVAELAAFRRGVLRAGGISMVGTMLQDATDRELRLTFRSRIVAPRRARIRAILEAAVDEGDLPSRTDVELAVASCTGTLYALALAGEPIPDDYAERIARRLFQGS